MSWYKHVKGFKNEYNLINIIQQYTDMVYHNVILNTNLTKSGVTEIDIIAIINNMAVIFETKSVVSIDGNYSDRFWNMSGTTCRFTTFNTIIQNKLHSRVFKDIYFKCYGHYCDVMSIIAVPNNTYITGDISEYITPFYSVSSILTSIKGNTDYIIANRLIALLEEVCK